MQIEKILEPLLSFTERLEALDAQVDQDSLVIVVRNWLDVENHRFITVELNGNELKLLEEPQFEDFRAGTPSSVVARMLTVPSNGLPGSHTDEWGCNLGFRIVENGKLTGHFVWPKAFNREAVPAGLTPHEVRQRLLRLGHLHAEPGRTTTHLPRTLAKISAQGQPREVLEAHSSAGLKYRRHRKVKRRNLQVRALALRGFYKGGAI